MRSTSIAELQQQRDELAAFNATLIPWKKSYDNFSRSPERTEYLKGCNSALIRHLDAEIVSKMFESMMAVKSPEELEFENMMAEFEFEAMMAGEKSPEELEFEGMMVEHMFEQAGVL